MTNTTDATTTTPDRTEARAEAMASHRGRKAATKAASKAATSETDTVKEDARTPAERTAAEVEFYAKAVTRNEADHAKVEAEHKEIHDKVLLAGDESALADLPAAREKLELAELRLQGSRNALARAAEAHRLVTAGDVTERVAAVVNEVSDPAILADLRDRVGVILEAERLAAESRNETISAAVAEAIEAGLPTTTAGLDQARDRWYAKAAKVTDPDTETRAEVPVTVITGVAPRPKLYDATATQREGVGDGLLAGGRYAHEVDPDREAALRVCLAVGVDVAALEAAVRARNNKITAFSGIQETEKLIADAWTIETR